MAQDDITICTALKGDNDIVDIFRECMGDEIFCGSNYPESIAVGVSGGADSMVLCSMLSEFFLSQNIETHIFAISVDHRLRPEGAEEARFVGKVVGSLPNVSHHILVWEDGDKQDTRIEEKARTARYDLIYGFMEERKIFHLFLGHHRNDQAETFLYRLAKGSGLDGLACMSCVSEQKKNNVILCRPLLGVDKQEILDYAKTESIPYIEDPSNEDERYARVRLRKSMAVLSEEGLTSKRLYTTAKRLKRSRDALEYIADKEYKNSILKKETDCIVFDYKNLLMNPVEVVIRIIMKAIEELQDSKYDYSPRMERVENLCEDLMKPSPFRKRTLRGIIFDYNKKKGIIILSREKKS